MPSDEPKTIINLSARPGLTGPPGPPGPPGSSNRFNYLDEVDKAILGKMDMSSQDIIERVDVSPESLKYIFPKFSQFFNMFENQLKDLLYRVTENFNIMVLSNNFIYKKNENKDINNDSQDMNLEKLIYTYSESSDSHYIGESQVQVNIVSGKTFFFSDDITAILKTTVTFRNLSLYFVDISDVEVNDYTVDSIDEVLKDFEALEIGYKIIQYIHDNPLNNNQLVYFLTPSDAAISLLKKNKDKGSDGSETDGSDTENMSPEQLEMMKQEEIEMMINVITSHAFILDIQLLTDNKVHIITSIGGFNTFYIWLDLNDKVHIITNNEHQLTFNIDDFKNASQLETSKFSDTKFRKIIIQSVLYPIEPANNKKIKLMFKILNNLFDPGAINTQNGIWLAEKKIYLYFPIEFIMIIANSFKNNPKQKEYMTSIMLRFMIVSDPDSLIKIGNHQTLHDNNSTLTYFGNGKVVASGSYHSVPMTFNFDNQVSFKMWNLNGINLVVIPSTVDNLDDHLTNIKKYINLDYILSNNDN